MLILKTSDVSAQLPPPTLTPTTYVLLATPLDTGTPTLRPVLPAPLDSTSMRLLSVVSALLLLPTSMPAVDVLLVTPPTTGTPPQRPAFHAPETAIGMLQPLDASAALKVSLSIPPNSDVPALPNILTTMLPTRNVSPAIVHHSGMMPTQNVLAALKDLNGMPRLQFALALELPPTLTQEPENALNAPSKSPSGTEELALLALLELTMTLNPRPAQFALKDLSITPPKEPATLLHDDL